MPLPTIKNLFLSDRFIFIIILINSLTIFIEGFNQLHPTTFRITQIVDSVITLLFIFEAIVKINQFGWRGYFESTWNKFDFILIVLSAPSVLLFLPDTVLTNLSFLLVFRVSRVFKFIRFFRFIPGTLHLFNGISRALKASVFVLIGFFVYNFVISVLSCYLFRDLSGEYFGDPIKSLYSTFKIFTIEGWYEIPDQIVRTITPVQAFFTKSYFIIILITGGILGLSLVNSIFVDSMVADNNDTIEHKIDELNAKVDRLIKNMK